MIWFERLLIGTSNKGKIREFEDLFISSGLSITTVHGVQPEEVVEETGTSYIDNAAIKALRYAELYDCPCLADDSGIEIRGLRWGPGHLTKDWPKKGVGDVERNAHILAQLLGRKDGDRAARFECAIVLATPGAILNVTRACLHGKIGTVPRGEGGFGADSIFIPEPYCWNGSTVTLAEFSTEAKNRISHRGRALREMIEWMKREGR